MSDELGSTGRTHPLRHSLRIVERTAFLMEATNIKGIGYLECTKRRDVGPGGLQDFKVTPHAHMALQFATRETAEDLLGLFQQAFQVGKQFVVTEHIFEEPIR